MTRPPEDSFASKTKQAAVKHTPLETEAGGLQDQDQPVLHYISRNQKDRNWGVAS